LARRVATVASSTSDRAGPDELVIGTTWEFASHSKALRFASGCEIAKPTWKVDAGVECAEALELGLRATASTEEIVA